MWNGPRAWLRRWYWYRALEYGLATTRESVRHHLRAWAAGLLISALTVVLAAIVNPSLVGAQVPPLLLSVPAAALLVVIVTALDVAAAPARMERDMRRQLASVTANRDRLAVAEATAAVAQIVVQAAPGVPLRVVDDSEAAREQWLAAEFERVMQPLVDWRATVGRKPRIRSDDPMSAAIAQEYQRIKRLEDAMRPGEPRTPEQYEAECRDYIAALRTRWVDCLAEAAAEVELAPLRLVAINVSPLHQPDVLVRVIAPEGIRAFRTTRPTHLHDQEPLPEAPPTWMPGLGDRLVRTSISGLPLGHVTSSSAHIAHNGHQAVVTYPSVTLRPDLPVRLDDVWLALPSHCGGQTVPFEYEVRGPSISRGVQKGTFEVTISPEVLSASLLVDAARQLQRGEKVDPRSLYESPSPSPSE